jgi:hypothetical protein
MAHPVLAGCPIHIGKWDVVMDHKQNIHAYLLQSADELLAFIRSCEADYSERWVPDIHIKTALALNFVATPQAGKQYGPKGWLFAILARILEDQGRLEHKRTGSRSFSRSSTTT